MCASISSDAHTGVVAENLFDATDTVADGDDAVEGQTVRAPLFTAQMPVAERTAQSVTGRFVSCHAYAWAWLTTG